MSVAQNKAALLRLYDEAVSNGRLEVIDELVHPDVEIHSPLPSEEPGAEGLRSGIAALRATFGDFTVTPDDVIGESDKVVGRFTVTGVHRGTLLGVAPTGIACRTQEIAIARFEDGRIVELWVAVDLLSLLHQVQSVAA